MDKQAFLNALEAGLAGLPQADIDERLGFYAEMIDDRVEEGRTEAEAVAELGTVEDIVAQIVAETPLTRIVRERMKPARRMRAWEIVLLVLGFPLWFPLLMAAFAVVLTVYIVIWAVIVTLWAVELSFAVGVFGGVAAGILSIVRGRLMPGAVLLCAAVVLAGLSIFLFFGCKAVTVGAAKLTKRIALWIKSLFMRKRQGE